MTDHPAIELYRQALADHTLTKRGEPRPTAPAEIETHVRRLPATLLSDSAALAEIEQHLAAFLHPRAANMLFKLKASPPGPAKKSLGLWAKKSVKREADKSVANHALQVAALESAVDHLLRDKVPPMFAHLMPKTSPVIHGGPDQFVKD
jgi:hypothetical protein